MFYNIYIMYGALLTEEEALSLVKNYGLYFRTIENKENEDSLCDILYDCSGQCGGLSEKFEGLMLMEIPHDMKDFGGQYILGVSLEIFDKEKKKLNSKFPLMKMIGLQEKYMENIKRFEKEKELYELLTKSTELCLVPDDCRCCS